MSLVIGSASASTARLSPGDVRKALRHNLRPWFWIGSSILRKDECEKEIEHGRKQGQCGSVLGSSIQSVAVVPATQVKCQLCHREGHDALGCRLTQGGPAGRLVRCRGCNQSPVPALRTRGTWRPELPGYPAWAGRMV